MSRLATASLAALLGAATLAGCGSGDDDRTEADRSGRGSRSPDGTSSFDAATATLTDETFCDRIDPAAVADALGMPGAAKLEEAHQVGKPYKTSFGKVIATSNSCSYVDRLTAPEARFVVSVKPNADPGSVASSLDTMRGMSGKPGQSDKCQVTETKEYGDPAGVIVCRGTVAKDRVQVYLTGLVGGSGFNCGAVVMKGAAVDELRRPVLELCASTLRDLATT